MVTEAENAHAVQIKDSMEPENQAHIEVYDSGCTRHITPYCKAVTDFTEISPKLFQVANQQSFNAVGTGEMVINIPNGVRTSQLKLTEVLYSSDVGYTLVSIGQLDDAGFTVIFANGKCIIQEQNRQQVGIVVKSGWGLYRVAHNSDIANTATEVLSLDQFHHCMGHISPETTRKLVTNGLVTEVKLEISLSGNPFFCESCIYAKAT